LWQIIDPDIDINRFTLVQCPFFLKGFEAGPPPAGISRFKEILAILDCKGRMSQGQ
jgi:hypothetical protein